MSDASAVLVVEDDLSIQGLLVAVVKHLGLPCRAAGDGRAALSLIAEEKPSAIVLDLIMPEMDGFGVLRELKTRAPELLPKTVVISAAVIRDADTVADLRGVAKFLRKPLDVDQLAAAVLRCAGLHDAGKDAGRGSAYETPPRP